MSPVYQPSNQAKGLPVSIYGSGSDGAVVLSVDTDITTPKNYTNLTINAGVTLTLTAPISVSAYY
jgi:hypothetical protein